ncbi:putative prolyl 4-hydroxylase 7 [Forsythia ovata]|uniref:procollagen-proline 4-dioxygenase n=1 Tax=Forsythia ovata TaxID=205694 RepID=A0ABD1UEH8_9LAMI
MAKLNVGNWEILNMAKDKPEKSMVVYHDSGESIESEDRSSSGIEWFRYEHGQKYELHFDYFDDEANQQLGGHLVATVLMYSLNIEKGGETVFPSSEVRNGPQQSGYTVHVSLFDIPSKSSSRDCNDKDPHCPAWGLHGECERNPQYMVGSEDDLGYCRKSCKVCSS